MFVTEAALIALREGLEAVLITGILLGLVSKLGRPDARKYVWAGFAAAAAASVVLGIIIQRFLFEAFEEGGGAAWFELIAVLAAVPILTYMVFWMWQHTRGLMAEMSQRVKTHLAGGALFSIVALTFASVIREGLEVVLFYAALVGRATPFDLAWSGLVGFVVSVVLVVALLRGAARFDLSGFFAVSGILLVFIAAGLLVHGVMAATDVGLLEPAPRLWDTSSVLDEDSALGRILHATIGYAATPTLLQGLLYFGYLFGVGGAYLFSLGAFHRRTTTGRVWRPVRAGAAALAVLVAVGLVAAGAANPGALVEAHEHGPGGEAFSTASLPDDTKVGILLRSHGEPVHYNETTYQSFADFVRDILVMTGNEALLAIDQGTVLLDADRPFAPGPMVSPRLMDAWTHAFDQPAAYGGDPLGVAAAANLYDGLYVAPAGPGLGEPDILEIAGLDAYREWLQMAGVSPMHETKGRMLDAVEARLRELFGQDLVVVRAYSIVPHVSPGLESFEDAARALVAADVDLVVDAYTSAISSDTMDACMMRPHFMHALDAAGFEGKVLYVRDSGATHDYAHAVATEVASRLAELPADAKPALFLTHHGAKPDATNPCGSGAERYHGVATRMYELALAALSEEGVSADVTRFQVYGQGAGASDDGVLSIPEAVDAARAAGATHILDLPFELTGNGYDNLVVQRGHYGLDPAAAPHYGPDYETRLTVQGMHVRILSSTFGTQARADALIGLIVDALGASDDHADGGHSHSR